MATLCHVWNTDSSTLLVAQTVLKKTKTKTKLLVSTASCLAPHRIHWCLVDQDHTKDIKKAGDAKQIGG